jgi:GT2 family glycosyltransferase
LRHSFIVVTSGAHCSVRQLRKTANSLRESSIVPNHWIISESSLDHERVTRTRKMRTSSIVIARSDVVVIEHAVVVFLRAGDELSPNALAVIDQKLTEQPGIDFIYGDSSHGRPSRFEEVTNVRRPGWSPERLRSHNYVGDLVAVRARVAASAGGATFLSKLHSHDRSLRLSEHSKNAVRIAEVLCLSTQDRIEPTASLDAVTEHCTRTGINAECSIDANVPVVRVNRHVSRKPKISVIVPTRGTVQEIRGKNIVMAAHAIRSLRNTCTYKNLEIVAVLDKETTQESRNEIIDAGSNLIKVVEYDQEFNFAEKVNLGVVNSDGDYILLLNDDTEFISHDAIETLMGLLEDPEVAMAGPMLFYEDGLIQSAGHILNPIPYDLYRHRSPQHVGAQNMLRVQREVSGVIAACVLIKRSAFLEVGGLCTLFPSNYNDVDFGLKLRDAGYRIVWTPHAQLYHFESKTRSPKLRPFEVASIGKRWRDKLDDDPYFNPHLERYISVWKQNVLGQRSLVEALGPTAPIASK